jgi:hypothetical protein
MENLMVVNEMFSETVARYVSREMDLGKDPRRTMTRLMGNWVLNALVATPRADKKAIRTHWTSTYTKLGTRPPRTRKKRSKKAHEMAETQALVYIRMIDYEGAKSLAFDELRLLARKFVSRRVFSGGVHRAGYIPALRVLRKPAGERPPRYKNEPGTEPQWTMTPDQLSVEVTNFAKIIQEIAPEAFEIGATKLQGYLASYLTNDIVNGMKNAGLNAK